MIGLNLRGAQYGITPIDPDFRSQLTKTHAHLLTLDDLNKAEAQNNLRGMLEVLQSNLDYGDVLDSSMLRDIHWMMFGDVWKWAGAFRRSGMNIGVDPGDIQSQLHMLVGNVKWQLDNGVAQKHNVGAEFHHGLVRIHCFPNGNGRHARLVANVIAQSLGLGDNFYTWGSKTGLPDSHSIYINSLRHADSSGDLSRVVAAALS
jgi:Fic-DOC domain mobile mystery protein B